MTHKYILAIDQGTTSTRSCIFDDKFKIVASCQLELQTTFPQPGWVEQNPTEIWNSVVQTIAVVLKKIGSEKDKIVSIGISNQRETTILWDKVTGKAVYNAIVWQDRRTDEYCNNLKKLGYEAIIKSKTGLCLDPYFSATKIKWILENNTQAQELLKQDRLLFGTVDSFIIWNLTKGKKHYTDITNASRTALFNIKTLTWDKELLNIFDTPSSILPTVLNNTDEFGTTDSSIIGANIPIRGVAGDQQAAAIGQACFQPGMIKATYGTGCFLLLNTGKKILYSKNNLLTTIAYKIDNDLNYALEGSVLVAGAAMRWLRDKLKVISESSETSELAKQSDQDQNIYLVPAFTGFGAPYWDAQARGSIFGLTLSCGIKEIARATLEGCCFQTKDLIEAIRKDYHIGKTANIRVDGGMSHNDYAMQFLSSILPAEVIRPMNVETTITGSCYLSGLASGLYPPPTEFSKLYATGAKFTPAMNEATVKQKYNGWLDAVERTKSGYRFNKD